MRVTAVLFLIITLAYLVQPALSGSGCGSNWLGNDAVGNDPDFNYAANTNKAYSTPAVSLDKAATKPRVPPDERKKGYPNSNPVNMSMPDPSPKPLATDDAGANVTEAETAPVEMAPVEVSPPEPVVDTTPSVEGKWTVALEGTPARSLSLILIPMGETGIMGSGSLDEGGKTIPLTLSGTVKGNEVKIKAKSSTPEYENNVNRQFNLDLAFVNETLSGRYEAISGDQILATGNATATVSGAAGATR